MHGYTVIQTSLTFRLAFGNIVTSLPVPGTRAFTNLCRGLKRFGLTSEKFSLETPSARLSDVRLVILLLQDRVTVRMQYECFEIVVPVLLSGQEEVLIDITNTALSTLAEFDQEIEKGFVTVQAGSHLNLEATNSDLYLKEHLVGGDASLESDAFAFNLLPTPGDDLKRGRLVIARSVPFEGALFIDYLAEYSPPKEQFTIEFVDTIRSGFQKRLSSLGLNEVDPIKV